MQVWCFLAAVWNSSRSSHHVNNDNLGLSLGVLLANADAFVRFHRTGPVLDIFGVHPKLGEL